MHCIAEIIMLRPPVIPPATHLYIDKILLYQDIFFQTGNILIGQSLYGVIFFTG